jgi:hypothetical protein
MWELDDIIVPLANSSWYQWHFCSSECQEHGFDRVGVKEDHSLQFQFWSEETREQPKKKKWRWGNSVLDPAWKASLQHGHTWYLVISAPTEGGKQKRDSKEESLYFSFPYRLHCIKWDKDLWFKASLMPRCMCAWEQSFKSHQSYTLSVCEFINPLMSRF